MVEETLAGVKEAEKWELYRPKQHLMGAYGWIVSRRRQ